MGTYPANLPEHMQSLYVDARTFGNHKHTHKATHSEPPRELVTDVPLSKKYMQRSAIQPEDVIQLSRIQAQQEWDNSAPHHKPCGGCQRQIGE